MSIDTQKLRAAAFRAIDESGLAWYSPEELCGRTDPPVSAQFIAAANPKAIVDLIDNSYRQAARIEAQDIIVSSVAAALARQGVTEADDPGEAIDVLVADLRGVASHETLVAQAAADEIERLRTALLWNAAALNACCVDSIREASNITIKPDTKTFGEILDMADAALGRAALQGESHD